MPSSKNIQAVEELKTKLDGAKAVILADYLGLTVAQMGDLRDKIRAAAGELSVAKNTLIKLALQKPELDSVLQGPTAILIAKEDEISPLKALVEFAKNAELPKLKAGILDDRILSTDELNQLAKLPGKLELQAKVVGVLKGPLYGLVNVLSGNTRKLVYVLNAIKDQKSKGGDS